MPRAIADFSPIYTTEQVVLTFDFSLALGAGESLITSTSPIISPAVTIAVVSGIDSTPSARLIGTPSISGGVVLQTIGTLIPGTVYDVIATVATTGNQILVVNSHQQCMAIT